ncbi:MAG: hypothetical protein A3F68_09715 [Acidobacteria bacterium RIFCSPLOWO2_12_FULL_54_10]|nr:MAG: hypothetical protein A3F68_09715 [Acidobacteria bacterium RIFCSPLOWO2_12_FULL_54_10]
MFTVCVLAFAASLLVASARVQMAIDREESKASEVPEALLIPSGNVVRKLSMGHDGLMADIYWTRVVQYFGGRLRDRHYEFRLLPQLLNITVTLDPQLMIAYNFGAFFLATPPPYGAGMPKESVALLRRGIEANPDEWRLWHYMGFIYYWELQDYQNAAKAYEEGSKHSKARTWMKVMAAAIRQKGGDREISRFLWSDIYQTTEDETIRENAQKHLETLKALDDIDEIRRVANLFHDQTGRWPQSFEEMSAQGLMQGIPQDPQGFPYVLKSDGEVILNPESTMRPKQDPLSR